MLLVASLINVLLANAAQAGSHADASLVFQGFMACEQQSQSQELCLKEYLHPEVPTFKVKDYLEWFAVKDTVGRPSRCPAETEKFMKAFPEHRNQMMLCFPLQRGKKKTRGFAFFSRYADRILLKEIRFSLSMK